MIVVLDRQHAGKPGKSDLGAGVDLDGDGTIETHEMEANLTPLYIAGAKQYLEIRSHNAAVFQNGWYSERHQRANTLATTNPITSVAYIACHLNAGKGDYASIFHDERSRSGKALAEHIADALRGLELHGVKRILVKPANPNDWTKHAWNTIRHIYNGPNNISGVCFEPLFMDNEAHQPHLTPGGLHTVGQALATGCLAWDAGK
jgi:uncharacterized protein (DUF2141 family)